MALCVPFPEAFATKRKMARLFSLLLIVVDVFFFFLFVAHLYYEMFSIRSGKKTRDFHSSHYSLEREIGAPRSSTACVLNAKGGNGWRRRRLPIVEGAEGHAVQC